MSGPPGLPPERTWRDLLNLALDEDIGPSVGVAVLLAREHHSSAVEQYLVEDTILCGGNIDLDVTNNFDIISWLKVNGTLGDPTENSRRSPGHGPFFIQPGRFGF